MKKISFLLTATIVVASVVSAASASAATLQWLEDGHVLASAQPYETTGELLLRATNGGGLGVNAQVLCAVSFMGTVGPGIEDEIASVLGGAPPVGITLLKPLLCSNESNCAEPLVAPANLPWLSELQLMEPNPGEVLALDILVAGAGGGPPGWEIQCITIFGLIEETCTGSVGFNIVNDATESDVLGEFNEKEIELSGEQASCTLGGVKTGLVETDGSALIFLDNGKLLAVSYE